MSPSLSPAEARILDRLAATSGAVPEESLDAEALASLASRGLVMRLGGFARLTPEGRAAAVRARGAGPGPASASRAAGATAPPARPASPPPAPPSTSAARPAEPERPDEPAPEPAPFKLNELQEDLLRRLVHGTGPLPLDDVDGRVVRALEGRGLVDKGNARLQATEEGRAYFDKHVRRRRRVRSAWMKQAPASPARGGGSPDEVDERKARARLLRNSVESLRRVIGDAEEIEVGDLKARASDAFDALLELADRIERGDDPRRIPPPGEGRR